MLCTCGDDEIVPEIGYRICRRRVGVIPQVLAPLIERRMALKREGEGRRANALKWLLVTSFGYTGYRNAKLGRIEAHEAINAYGREYLLRSAEIAASMGFRVIHGIVDSLWVTGPGDVQELAQTISREIGIPMAIEGTFRWMVFLPARHGGGALNRFYGVRDNGGLKVRGLALRRRDTPPLVAETQMNALRLLASARDEPSFLELIPGVLDIYRDALERLQTGDVQQEELVIRRLISRRIHEYRRDTHLLAAMRTAGSLHPGQVVEYIVVRSRPPQVALPPSDCRYDVSFYADLLVRSAEELLRPFGWTVEKIGLTLCRSGGPPLHQGVL
jgi:DNA polymerase elongation subunit (family B)